MNNNEPARDRLRTPRQALAPLALHAFADRSLASADPKQIAQPKRHTKSAYKKAEGNAPLSALLLFYFYSVKANQITATTQ